MNPLTFGPADGFAQRLRGALALRRPRMTLHQFADAMRERDRAQRKQNDVGVPHSYRTLWLYKEGRRGPADELFAKAAASVLGVRWQWLHQNAGPMTDAVIIAAATLAVTGESKVIGARSTGGEATVRRLALIASPLANFNAGLTAFTDVWDRLVRSSPALPDSERQYAIAAQLWSVIAAPLALVGTDPRRAPPAYYLGALAALMTAIPGPQQGNDLSRPPRKHPSTPKGGKPHAKA